ncbi:MAG: SRPBCC family protein [Deltaproteobacteria bacterium]|nr:SRPBCC family protein [Deltaproteobacteria bacterium]
MKIIEAAAVVVSFFALGFASAASAEAPGPWEVVAKNDRVVVKARSHPGSEVKEVVAQGKVAVAAWILKNVVDDIDGYPALIPFTTVARVVHSDDQGGRYAFQRLEMPFLQKREYVTRVFDESTVTPEGRNIYKMSWTSASARFAPMIDKEAIRLDVNDGSWTFEEQADGSTFATFRLFVDPSGSLPTALVNFCQQVTLGQYLGNLETLSQQPRYRTKRQVITATTTLVAAQSAALVIRD